MKKVVYSVIRFGRTENFQMKGVGYITDTDLVIACVSKNQKPYSNRIKIYGAQRLNDNPESI